MNLQDCCGASRQDFFKRIGAVGTGSLFGSAGLIAHALANRFVRYSRPLQRRCFTAATGDAGLEISRARLTDSAPELWNSVYTV